MSNQQNLHPEQRPDKNGNIVTRWVRSFRGKPAIAPLPAPALSLPTEHRPSVNRAVEAPSGMTREERIAKTQEALLTLFPNGTREHYGKYEYDYDADERLEGNIAFLLKHDPEALSRVLESASSSGEELEFWSNRVLKRNLHPSRNNDYGYDGYLYGDEKVSDRTRDYFLSDYHTGLATISFLKKMDFIAKNKAPTSIQNFESVVHRVLTPHMEEDKTSSERVIEGIAAFSYLKGFHKEFMFSTSNMSNTIYDDNVEDILYLSERVDKLPGIVTEVQKRGVTDMETIKLLIESPTTAMADGEL